MAVQVGAIVAGVTVAAAVAGTVALNTHLTLKIGEYKGKAEGSMLEGFERDVWQARHIQLEVSKGLKWYETSRVRATEMQIAEGVDEMETLLPTKPSKEEKELLKGFATMLIVTPEKAGVHLNYVQERMNFPLEFIENLAEELAQYV